MRGSLFSKLLAGAARLAELRRDERGNVIIYVTITSALLLGITGLAIDGSRAMITHSEAQAAADAAALAGASQLDGQPPNASDPLGACGRAKSEASAVANQQRFAQGGPANITIAAGSPVCLSGLPTSDSSATTGFVTTSDAASQYIQVTTQQLTHQNTLLAALTTQNTALIQRTATAGFRRSLCAASPVMMVCDTIAWTPGVAFDAWSNYGGNKGFVSDCGPSANCIQTTLASLQPTFCLTDSSILPQPGNKTNKAADGINTRFGIGSSASQPSDKDTVDFQNYSSEVPGATKKGGASGWNCNQYWIDKHGSDGLAKPAGCTATATAPTTRYSVYQAERAANKIPSTGSPSTTSERRLLYLAVFNCSAGTIPEAYLKTFMIGPASGPPNHTIYVEPIGLATSKTDPTAIHEEVQLYR